VHRPLRVLGDVPNFTERQLIINGKEVLSEKRTLKEFSRQALLRA